MSSIINESFDALADGAIPASLTLSASAVWGAGGLGYNGSGKAFQSVASTVARYAYGNLTGNPLCVRGSFWVKTPDDPAYGNQVVSLANAGATSGGLVTFKVDPGQFRIIAGGTDTLLQAFSPNTWYFVRVLALMLSGPVNKYAIEITPAGGTPTLYANTSNGGYNFNTGTATNLGRLILTSQTVSAGVTAGTVSVIDELQVNSLDSTATTYVVSGPTNIPAGSPATFNISLPTDAYIPANVTFTPSDGGAGGTFSPTTVVLTPYMFNVPFTYTNSTTGAKNISVTNSSSLTNPSPVILNVDAAGNGLAVTPFAVPFAQRSGDVKGKGGSALIQFSGTYTTGTPTGLEWRFMPDAGPNNANGTWTAWTALSSATIGSGAWTGQATLPAGQGPLQIRWTNDTTAVTTTYYSVGDIVGCWGQSNMSGRGTSNQVAAHPIYQAKNYGNDDVYKDLVDPYDSGVGQIDPISSDGTGATNGSYIIALGQNMMSYSNCPVMFVPAARGGTAINLWAQPTNHVDTTTYYGSGMRRLKKVISQAQSGAVNGSVKAIIWHQGESDESQTQTYYANALNALVNAVVGDLPGCKFMPALLQKISNTGYVPGGVATINLAIKQVSTSNTNAPLGADLSDLTLAAPDSNDNLHLNSSRVLTFAADRWFQAMLLNLWGAGATTTPAPTTTPRFIGSSSIPSLPL
ncbi:hypothetical protein EON83_17265 [bacterium]|nr:MAG: hypothetical protein EON83_17265 [bacterium]